MATILFSALVNDVRGKVGGVVFQRNANGSVVRALKSPTKKNSESLTRQQLNMSVYASKWRGLTQEERQSWIDARTLYPYTNRVGTVSYYTGFQLFMKTNLNLETAALT